MRRQFTHTIFRSVKSGIGIALLAANLGWPAVAAAQAPAAAGDVAGSVPEEFRGKSIKVAVYNDYAPDEFIDENGQLAGWSMDLANAAAKLMGVEFDYEPVGFDSIIPGLQNGRYRIAISSLNPKPERREVLDFVPLREGGGSFATKKGGADIATWQDLCGKSVAAAAGSTNAMDMTDFSKQCVAANAKPIALQEFPQFSNALLAVQSGRVEVVTGSTTALLYAIAQNGGNLEPKSFSTGFVPQCVGFPNDSTLAQPFAAAINTLIEDGTYERIMKKWGIEKLGTIGKAEVLR